MHMWIERFASAQISKAVGTRPVVLLTGARQTGKTSLLRRLFPKHRFVTLDLPSEAEQAEKAPEAFLRRYPPPLVIDEVQYAPGLFRQLKIAVDAQRNVDGQFILTGSQKHRLMESAVESLAGRIQTLELEALCRAELRSAGLKPGLNQSILRGGYPELWARPELDATSFYRSYIATYLERDVRSLLNVGSLRDFERFIRACALRSGQLLNKAELARDVGIAPSTAGLWLGVLQASGVIVLLEPWFANQLKSLVKSPKLYVADTGLLCTLLGIGSEEDLLSSPLLGAIWESFVFSELRRLQLGRTGAWQMYFLADRSNEVDFVTVRGGRIDMVEAKWAEHPGPGDASGMEAMARKLGARHSGRQRIVCRTRNPYPVTSACEAVGVDDLEA
jgi:predicted AAA+ superfamily ATPase